MRIFVFCVMLLPFVLNSCASKSEFLKGDELKRTITQEAVGEDCIVAMGIGAADPDMENKTQRLATSRSAAIVQAQYEMLTIIKGVTLTGGITVAKAMETDSLLSSKIDAEVKGAEIVKTEWTADDGCVVSLKLPKKRLKAMGLKMIK
ncbi:hypothetical protein HY792_03105 [Candidatus Desantisbacteria bacterium]|nr:hypothetical protein [Candidatus Desantisbacteria bacterium]